MKKHKLNKWKAEENEQGRVEAISFNGYYILHLSTGTERNELCAKELVKLLNEHEIIPNESMSIVLFTDTVAEAK